MRAVLYSCLLLIGSLEIANAGFGRMYHKCVEYKDNVPDVAGALKSCIKGWNEKTYCKFFNNPCPDIQECNNHIAPSPRHNCMLCPDVDCVYNGNAYVKHEVFDSVDGINRCECLPGGTYRCENKDLGQPITFCH